MAHRPRVVRTRRPTPESVLLAILRTKPQSSSKQQVEEGQAICIPQSCPSRDTAQHRECQVQRETLDAGGMGEPFFSSSKLSNGTVEIASGRPQNAQIQLRALWSCCCSWWRSESSYLNFYFPLTLVLSLGGHLFYLSRKAFPLNCLPRAPKDH